ncbi:tRNA (adenosine(37)-N6)-dimethylallyltransferase MiaA [Sandaracinobacter neustonicus]|uniref:tRNA dimethylallyltransferase n=2 Tax=Sandaracinobacter neustonicus TaxID=1715348 RepID=A0A501XVU0_9SPHN|nr:tRNA (adenosine(37)-N6)-dimethylallyltransferase MiaA [Sandaracinobacter neustonicus]TPE64726.1 tRNA (adenosine(37)-N6)-dimethylallyltransferase MiaA [Sandaracinobacter neustonicus]
MERVGPPLAVIAGPTASGKSALALEMAMRENGVILNADASQIYADLPILSAAPPPDEQAQAPHRLFGVIDGAESCTAARWAALARAEIAAAHAAGRLPILVGGTGLYLRTLLGGIAPVPEIPADVRAAVRALSTEQVRDALSAEDALMAARLHANDTQRNARALEVMRATGQSLAQWQAAPPQGGLLGQVELRPLVIDIPRDLLVQRIDRRIEAMWQSGALEEVRRLAARNLSQTLPVMRAIGVPPLLALLRGEVQVAEMIERWRLDTRQYAKRQATWARNQTGGWPRIVTRPI